MRISEVSSLFALIIALTISCKVNRAEQGFDLTEHGIEVVDSDGLDHKLYVDANDYFVTVRPSEDIDFTFRGDAPNGYDIWYLYTNASDSDIQNRPPTYSVLNNFISAPLTAPKISKYNDDAPIAIRGIRGIEHLEHLGDIDYSLLKSDDDGSKDYVGKKIRLIEILSVNRGTRPATCKVVRTVETALGERTLVIYEEDNIAEGLKPSDSDYQAVADLFLKEGFDNDIFDKMTGMFGDDWGYYNSTSKVNNNNKELIPKDDTITIFYCDINYQGAPKKGTSYVAGYFYDGNYKNTHSAVLTNARAMITIHAPASVGEYLGDSLSTLAHEFQHLIHSQYYSPDGYGRKIKEINASITECFSSAAESYISQWISEEIKNITGNNVAVPGPFCVGYSNNGFLSETSNAEWLEKGRGPFFLKIMDQKNLLDWASNETSQADADENAALYDYGIVASFANYLLVNYGTSIFKYYTLSDTADLQGIVRAINACYKKANITVEELIRNWGISVMLSKKAYVKAPYSHNRIGWYNISGMKVPSVNMWQYKVYDPTKSGIDNFGIQSSTYTGALKRYSNTPIKVKVADKSETCYRAKAPDFDPKLILTVLAIPR